MKLEEVKALIRQQGVTDELMAEFLNSLRRVHGGFLKAQHCYLLAYEIRASDYAGALRLIQYGYQHFAEDDVTRRFCYQKLGEVHQANGRADLAKPCYLAAKELLKREFGAAAGDTLQALRNELELTGYAWSADLEALYLETAAQDDLIWTLRPNRLLLYMAEYLVARHRQDEAFMRRAREGMMQLLFGAESTAADKLWQRHQVDTSILLGDDQEAFLRSIGVIG